MFDSKHDLPLQKELAAIALLFNQGLFDPPKTYPLVVKL